MSLTISRRFGMLLGLTLTTLASASAEAQFGSGGAFVSSPGDDGIQIERSLSGKSLYGYSDRTGSWDKLTAEPHPEDGTLNAIQTVGLAALRGKGHVYGFGTNSRKWASTETDGEPSPMILSARVAGCVAGSHLYAFGANQKDWAVLDLGEAASADIMTVHASRVVYRTTTHVHIFSNSSGKWASVDLAKD